MYLYDICTLFFSQGHDEWDSMDPWGGLIVAAAPNVRALALQHLLVEACLLQAHPKAQPHTPVQAWSHLKDLELVNPITFSKEFMVLVPQLPQLMPQLTGLSISSWEQRPLLDALRDQLTRVWLDWEEGDVPEDDVWLDVLLCMPKLRHVKLTCMGSLNRSRADDPCPWRTLDVAWLPCGCVPLLPLRQLEVLHVGVLDASILPDAAATAAVMDKSASILAAIAAAPHQRLALPEDRLQLRLRPPRTPGDSDSDEFFEADVSDERQGPQPESVQALLKAMAPLAPVVNRMWLGVKSGPLDSLTAAEIKALSHGLGNLEALDVENVPTSGCFWAAIRPCLPRLSYLMLSFPKTLDAAALSLFCGIASQQLDVEFYEPEGEAASVVEQVQRTLKEQGVESRVQLRVVTGTALPMCL